MNKLNILFIVSLLWLTMSCSEDEKTITDDISLNIISETVIDDITVKIYSENQEFKTGYNNIFVKFFMDTKEVDVVLNKFVPMMNMGMMQHSTPNEAYFKQDNYIVLPVSFVMPNGEGTYWYLDLDFSYEGKDYSTEAKFDVSDSENIKSFKYNDVSYFVTLIHPNSPIVGLNDFEVLINKKESMMMWPAVENLSIEVKPWMPDMDHGSPNNVNPASMDKGYYQGKINFTMTGLWTVTSTIKMDTLTIGEVVHTINF